MKKLCAFYFTGTGNTRYVVNCLCERLNVAYYTEVYDITENNDFAALLKSADVVMLAFPIYGSAPPEPMRKFVFENPAVFKNKDVIIIITQYMFSGDGAASLGRAIEKLGGNVIYAEHFNMPNNISDCKYLPIRNGAEINKILQNADKKIEGFADKIIRNRKCKRGFNLFSHATGYCCQRKYFRKGESDKKSRLKIDASSCIGCGLCSQKCPVKNIEIKNGKAVPRGKCALCYRCVNLCPKKAITLFGKNAPEIQYKGPDI